MGARPEWTQATRGRAGAATTGAYPGEALILSLWHEDVARFEMILDPDTQRALCRKAQSGDTSARDELVNSTLRLVEYIALRYARRSHVPLPDLIQEGAIGLLRAIERFDCEREGARFTTYACYWIQQGIARVSLADDNPIWIPHRVQERLMHARRGSVPSPSAARVSAADLDAAKRASYVKSLDAPLVATEDESGDEGTLQNVIADERVDVEALMLSRVDGEALARVFLDELLPVERRVLVLCFGLYGSKVYTLAEVARREGHSRQRAEQIKIRALMKLRQPHIVERLRQAVLAA